MHYQLQNLAEAADLFARALATDPDNALCHADLGNVLNALGRNAEAIASYQTALDLDPGLIDGRIRLGAAYLRNGDPRRAVDCLCKGAASAPSNPEFFNLLGAALQGLEQPQKAVEAFTKAIEIAPGYADALANLGCLLATLERHDEAIPVLVNALDAQPDDVELSTWLGRSLLAQKRIPEAVSAFARAIVSNPRDALLHNNLAVAYLELGQAETARDHLDKALELEPDFADAHNNLGNVYYKLGRYERARQAFAAALVHSNRHLRAQYNLAMVLEKQGQSVLAERAYRRVLEIDPAHADTYHSLSLLYYRNGDDAAAERLLRLWLQTDPDNAIARHKLAAFARDHLPHRASDAYIKQHFDRFAASFDQQLADIDYQAPRLFGTLLGDYFSAEGALDILDAGCGTGLCAPLLRPYARKLAGVDLSPAMLEQARKQALYDRLVCTELSAFIRSHKHAFDLIVIADTLVYFGALRAVLQACAAALRPLGALALSVEKQTVGNAEKPYVLDRSGRYQHSTNYLRTLLAQANFEIRTMREVVLRNELARPVEGFVILAERKR